MKVALLSLFPKIGHEDTEDVFRDGEWTFWYVNGQKRAEGTYKNGRGNPGWKAWTEDGQERWGWINDQLPDLPNVP